MSTTASSTVVPPSGAPQSPRTGRLRGLSYLRHYAHGHNHSTSPAAPTVTPANASSNSTSNHNNNTMNNHTPTSPSLPPSQPIATVPRQRSTSPLNNTASNAWLPTVSGISGLSRVASQPSAELSNTPGVVSNGSPGARASTDPEAVRSIDETISNPLDPTLPTAQGHPNAPLVRSPSNTARANQVNEPAASIRFIPHIDNRASRESLIFPPVERTLRFKDERIRVGRYSDRDSSNPSAPVGFKSKVVSRRHCEFWCDAGQWYVRDVKSSSGTFLNHIRLSAPGNESKAYPLYDGDILQLGIDFKGGEEQIFRCVKIRVELNRAWQKSLNNFNMSAHRRIRNLAKGTSGGAAKGKDGDAMSTHTSECSICLMPVAPCQSLFVAPCSHVWHYKCIRPLVEKDYPSFLCPNCRAIADLDRDIEEDELGEGWENFDDVDENVIEESGAPVAAEEQALQVSEVGKAPEPAPARAPTNLIIEQSPGAIVPPEPLQATTSPVEIRQTSSSKASGSCRRRKESVHDLEIRQQSGMVGDGASGSGSGSGSGSTSSIEGGHEGPMTPMNDAGPFVFDGGAFANLAESPTLEPLAAAVTFVPEQQPRLSEGAER
ncbi:uncharacterized protein H6S33_008333 [Morchella sextelata]|uniref:uncharacterized protein n=1 Tax=Morchella sextelata TaxID=1174677 RepID=UPI001D03EBFD|nr:uncharacterized protein H6S33_008333 [Morchella sextelata]KAH0602683.1 hypothetical protein H6S33_008333 [Morchella sextelata]